MIDYCLKFPDEATGREALFDGEQPKFLAVDVIGTIYKPTGKMVKSKEGDVAEMAPVEGWHANVRTEEEAPELANYIVVPETPQRIWL